MHTFPLQPTPFLSMAPTFLPIRKLGKQFNSPSPVSSSLTNAVQIPLPTYLILHSHFHHHISPGPAHNVSDITAASFKGGLPDAILCHLYITAPSLELGWCNSLAQKHLQPSFCHSNLNFFAWLLLNPIIWFHPNYLTLFSIICQSPPSSTNRHTIINATTKPWNT